MFFLELTVGEAEGVVGVDAVAAAPVDEVEKFLSEFFLCHVGWFGGVVGGAGDFFLHADGFDEGGQ